MMYTPKFKCPHCGNEVVAIVDCTDPYAMASGSLALCPCPEAQRAADESSRLAYQRKKDRRSKR